METSSTIMLGYVTINHISHLIKILKQAFVLDNKIARILLNVIHKKICHLYTNMIKKLKDGVVQIIHIVL
jgi:hypothetical protein